ncbi:MAG TPA: hypothetical protein VF519_15720 [Mycobacteriales bacterium]|jgi:hypothetical protein
MRRLFALPLIAAAFATASPAGAVAACTPTVVGACVSYQCGEICGPVEVWLYCDLDSHPRILACDLINQLG